MNEPKYENKKLQEKLYEAEHRAEIAEAENAKLRVELPQTIYNKVKEINCKSDNANSRYVFQTELGIDHARQERLLKEFIKEQWGIDVEEL